MDTEKRGRVESPKSRQLMVGLAILVLLAGGVLFAGLRFGREVAKASTPTTAGPDVTDGVVLQAAVVSIDPNRGEMTIRVAPVPRGSYGDIGFAKSLNMVTGTSNGVTETELKVGSPVTSLDFETALLDSQVSSYPFDAYEADLGILLAALPDGGTGAPAATVVPAQIRVESAVHGYKITAKPKLESTTEFGGEVTSATIVFDVERSGSTRFFAIFVMVLMWSISIGVLWIALTVFFRRRRIEVTMLSMFGIVLFALPNIRNAQPNAPPIGAFTDTVAFFWCESLVAASLVAMIVMFVRRSSEAS